MAETSPILIASDLSDASDVAVTRGMQLAGSLACPVIALHVIQEEPLWWVVPSRDLNPDDLRADLLREALATLRSQMHETAGRLTVEPVETQAQARFGKPAAVATEMAVDVDAALIVVGAHGHHAVRDWFVGTTAEKVVRAGNVPVLVARIEPTHGYQTVVVAVDFSESSRAALRAALAWAPRAQFTLVHAYETLFESYIDVVTYDNLRRELEDDLYERLRAFAHDAGVRSDHEPDYRVISGHPGTAVVDAAARVHADLTVCGTQGETGLRHLLLGSVAQHILREARSDVMTVRSPQEAG